METENGNKFFDENSRVDDSENKFNRFDTSSNDEHQNTRRESRPRFVRTDYSSRPQYSKVERPARPVDDTEQADASPERPYRSYNQERPSYGQERPSYGQGRPSYGQDRPAYGQGRPSYGQGRPSYGQDRPSYGQGRPSYGQNRSYGQDSSYDQNRTQRPGGYQNREGYGQNSYGSRRPYGSSNQYNNNQEGGQPRFYRERTQGQQEGTATEGGYQQNSGYQQSSGYQGNSYQRPYRPRPNVGGYRQNGYENKPYGQGNSRQMGAQKKQFIKKHIEYHDVFHDPNEDIRLNKYLANAGVCSRREADDFIKAGVVKVNGQTVTELGTKVKRGDNVLFHDQLVSIERKIYILLNKPKDCVTTVDDPQERKTVMDYIKGACKERVYPVGRLDRNTTGVLLLTNDGEMATRLTHPKFLKKKIYHVRLDRNVSAEDMQKLLDGVNIGDGDDVRADDVSYVNEDKGQVGVEIHSGRNRVVRRMFDALGYRVTKLDRVQFAGLTKKKLRRGDWRYLTDKEVSMLRMGAFE